MKASQKYFISFWKQNQWCPLNSWMFGFLSIVPELVRFQNGATAKALGTATAKLRTSHRPAGLEQVLYVPSVVANMLSIARTMDIGTLAWCSTEDKRSLYLCLTAWVFTLVICSASPKGGLVILDIDAPNCLFATTHVHPGVGAWHC